MLNFQGITHSYESATGTVPALLNIHVHIAPKELVCLLGPSGCGKSTLINIAAGFITPDKGDVLLQGASVKVPGRKSSMVFQEPSLMPWLNVEGNLALAFSREDKKLSKKELGERIDYSLQLVGLKCFNKAMPHELSGGMKQKVSLARSILMESPMLLMDEPFSSLDEQTRIRLNRDLISIWKRSEKTILFVTHSIQEALTIGTRIILMSARPGKISREWIPSFTDSSRDDSNPEFRELLREIRSSMELCCPPGGV